MIVSAGFHTPKLRLHICARPYIRRLRHFPGFQKEAATIKADTTMSTNWFCLLSALCLKTDAEIITGSTGSSAPSATPIAAARPSAIPAMPSEMELPTHAPMSAPQPFGVRSHWGRPRVLRRMRWAYGSAYRTPAFKMHRPRK